MTNETLNSSSLNASMSAGGGPGNLSSSTRNSLAAPQPEARNSAGPQKAPISIQGLKITTGNENGEIMKSYRESVEKYIKDFLIHQPGARTIYSTELLMSNIKDLFQKVQ